MPAMTSRRMKTITQQQLESWWDEVNRWETPKGFECVRVRGKDNRDHYRTMYDVFAAMIVMLDNTAKKPFKKRKPKP